MNNDNNDDDDFKNEIDMQINIPDIDFNNLSQYNPTELENSILDAISLINDIEPSAENARIIMNYVLPCGTTPENYKIVTIDGKNICIHKNFIDCL